MTERQKWFSDNVVVEGYGGTDPWWYVRVPESNIPRIPVPKKVCPDPQALAEFVDSQYPKPRFEHRIGRGSYEEVWDKENDYMVTAINHRYGVNAHAAAERLTEWLNEQEDNQ